MANTDVLVDVDLEGRNNGHVETLVAFGSRRA
jgi:hypothetical protein